MCRSFALRIALDDVSVRVAAGTVRIGWSAEEMRTWTDSTGKHKIEATFKEVANGKVTLVRKGGKEMEIELKKLSADDQAYVAKRVEDAEDDPFKAKSGIVGRQRRRTATTMPTQANLARVNRRQGD